MSLEICDCSNITLGDIGRPGCKVSWKVLSGMIFMFTKDSDGNRNKIDIADTLDQAYLDAKINHVDPTKRWYLTGQLYTIEGERAESNKFEASNGDLFKLSQGVRNRKAEVLDQGPELMERMEKHAVRFGTEIIFDHIHTTDLSKRPFTLTGDQGTYRADCCSHRFSCGDGA